MTARLVTIGDQPHAAVHFTDDALCAGGDTVACQHTNHDGAAPTLAAVADLPAESHGSWDDTAAALDRAGIPTCRLCRRCYRFAATRIPAHTRACWRPTNPKG